MGRDILQGMRVGVLSLLIAGLAFPKTVRLSNSDIVMTLDSGLSSPQLIQFGVDQSRAFENITPEPLIDHVTVNAVQQPLQWEFQAEASITTSKRVHFVYETSTPHLRLFWDWTARDSSGPIEHTIRILNLSSSEVWLPLQDSFRFHFRVAPGWKLDQFWVEKGASSPSDQGVHRVELVAGADWKGTSSTYAHPVKGEPREIIPYLLVRRTDTDSGWYVGIEFSGRTRITLRRRKNSVSGECGLNSSPELYRTRLAPGEAFDTPPLFVGAFSGDEDTAANQLRRWVRSTLNNRLLINSSSYPTLVSNSWGSGMAINAEQANKMMRDASDLGLEMFHLDAGWFRAIGDWSPSPTKFPEGIASLADDAHRLGLKFGLWTDWAQAGIGTKSGALNVNDPLVRNWLTTEPPKGWRPHDFKGITIDIGVPEARQWAQSMLQKLVGNFHLDMLEHDGYLVAQGCERQDHPHAPLTLTTAKRFRDEEFLWVEGDNDTDVSYHATRAYYKIQEGLREQFPGLLLEVCNDGGRMVDFGSAAHGDYFSITDAYDPVSNRRAFYDASYALPPAMLETYVEKWPTPNLDNFRYMLRSGMMGWFSLMQDSSLWSEEQKEIARSEFAIYKNKLRPLIRQADLYHISGRPNGVQWDGIEYFDRNTRHGALFVFRGSGEDETSHTFKLRGLQESSEYRVSFRDGSSSAYFASGRQVLRTGITVQRTQPNSSEIVFIDAT